MTIRTPGLTQTAGASAVAAGLLFIGVQIGHPELNATPLPRPMFTSATN